MSDIVVLFVVALFAVVIGIMAGEILVYAEWHNADKAGKTYHDVWPVGNGCMWPHREKP